MFWSWIRDKEIELQVTKTWLVSGSRPREPSASVTSQLPDRGSNKTWREMTGLPEDSGCSRKGPLWIL